MTSYKGISRKDSKEVFYWLDFYCHNKDPRILENDIVLQSKVNKYYFKKRIKIALFNIIIWSALIYSINELTKG